MTGAELRLIRKSLGMSQTLWGTFAGVTRSAVCRWETEREEIPVLVERVANVLDDAPGLIQQLMPELSALRKQLSIRQQLDNLEAALVEDIMATPDEELLAEVREDGGDPEAMAEQCREIFEKVKADV